MFKFDMSISQNYAMFKDVNQIVFVDSFDNVHFDVRFGTITESKLIGSIAAYSDEELNRSLAMLVEKYQ